ncbi:MAG: hypothetical protein LBR77_07580 [Lachnospiraceae bacterium]|jgi:predicted small integral membrane protein|nr:hypothetical protein [Lachnospiraceae bacterium]
MATTKKVTQVKSDKPKASGGTSGRVFTPTPEHKSQATTRRILAFVCWIVAIAAEVGAIFQVLRFATKRLIPALDPFVLIIILIVVDVILAIVGSMCWKKANRLDPPSERNKALFITQSELGVLMTAIAFIPLIVLIFMSKDIKGKQKGILGGIAVVAFLVAGFASADYSPVSQEQYAAETSIVNAFTGKDEVYWTKSGTKYHLYDNCYTINTDKTDEIFTGTVADAHADKNITELCKICESNARKDPEMPASQLTDEQINAILEHATAAVQ